MLVVHLRGGQTLSNETAHHQPKTIEVQLDSVTNLNRSELQRLWRDSYGSDPPQKISVLLMRQAIAHRLQVKHLGGLNFSTRRALKRVLDEPNSPHAKSRRIGNRGREWHRASARVARRRSSGDGDRDGRALPRKTLPLTVGSGTRDHRHALVRSFIFRSAKIIQEIKPWNRTSGTIRRCAIYTRKSSEEGLEQDFNSLHAQREACEAFIASQSSEGWRLVNTSV